MTRHALPLVAVAALLAAAPAALAQSAAGGAGRGGAVAQDRMRTVLFEGITLTADQQARIDTVTATYGTRIDSARREMMAARQSGQPVGAERMQAMRALQVEQRDALRTVLTAEQRARFDANVAAMSQGRGMGRGEGRGAGRGAGRGGRPPRG